MNLMRGPIRNENTDEAKPQQEKTMPTLFTPYGHDIKDLERSTTANVDVNDKNARNGTNSQVFK